MTSLPCRRTRSSGVAPTRFAHENVKQSGYRAASRRSRTRASIGRGRGREHVAGQHDLAQGPGGDPADRDRDGVRPVQCGQASVVPAQARRGGARVGQIAWISRRTEASRRTLAGRHRRIMAVAEPMAAKLAAVSALATAAGLTAVGDGGEPGQPGRVAAEDGPRHDQHGAIGGRVEGEAAERHRAGAGPPEMVLGHDPLEQGAQPFLPGGEAVLTGGQRDPCDFPPAHQPGSLPHPGQRRGGRGRGQGRGQGRGR